MLLAAACVRRRLCRRAHALLHPSSCAQAAAIQQIYLCASAHAPPPAAVQHVPSSTPCANVRQVSYGTLDCFSSHPLSSLLLGGT